MTNVILAPSGTGVFSYEVARRLINVEELEYTLETDEEPYEVACQSRPLQLPRAHRGSG